MKLRNKKTGEIVEVESLYLTQTQELYLNYINEENKQKVYTTDKIASFNLDWEDYEEPKSGIKDVWFPDVIEGRNNVVISFETKEEAKNAVEKLKAWKRLKELGFRFIDWELDMKTVADGKIWFDVGVNTEWNAEQLLELKPETKESLDILYGGEE